MPYQFCSSIVMLCAMLVNASTPAGMSHDHHEFTDVMICHHHEYILKHSNLLHASAEQLN
jgi:hypothetical protein